MRSKTSKNVPRGEARKRAGCHGALLLEVMLSLTLFVVGGGAVLGIVNQGVGSLQATRDKLYAADVARSAMAEIEAGISSPLTLNGPVRAWTDPDEELSGEENSGVGTGETRAVEWELRVETSPTKFDGLTLITVTAERMTTTGMVEGYTLSQLVRLKADSADSVGEEDDITKAAERGSQRQPSRERRSPQDGEPER